MPELCIPLQQKHLRFRVTSCTVTYKNCAILLNQVQCVWMCQHLKLARHQISLPLSHGNPMSTELGFLPYISMHSILANYSEL